jgi:hypothetical protein
MPFPTTAIIDNFNRANSDLDLSLACSNGVNSWFEGKINGGTDTSFDINTNQLKNNAPAGDSFIAGVNFGPDVEAYFSVPVLPADYVFLAVRIKDENTAPWDGYGLLYLISGTQWVLRRYDNGSATSLGTVSAPTLSAGDAFGLRVIGTSLAGFHAPGGVWNQTPVVTATDATYPLAGKIGIEAGDVGSGGAGRYDSFGGGTYIPPAAGDLLVETPWRKSRGVSW